DLGLPRDRANRRHLCNAAKREPGQALNAPVRDPLDRVLDRHERLDRPALAVALALDVAPDLDPAKGRRTARAVPEVCDRVLALPGTAGADEVLSVLVVVLKWVDGCDARRLQLRLRQVERDAVLRPAGRRICPVPVGSLKGP